MSRKKLIVLISTLVIILFGAYYWRLKFVEPTDILKYSDNYQISSNDFKGKVDNDRSANSNSFGEYRILERLRCSEGKVNFIIYSYMIPQDSWMKDKTDSRSLVNQRLIFKCYELYARKLRKKMLDLENPCNSDLDEIGEKNYEELKDFKAQINDDCSEENEDLKLLKINKWNLRLDSLLTEYSNYKMENY